MHCDFAFWVGGTHDNVKDIPELERLPGAAGIKVFMGSSTGSLLVADDEGVAAILRQTRRRAAFHSEDEYRLEERKPLRVAGDPSSHPVWRDEQSGARLDAAAGPHRPRATRGDPCAACLDGGGDRLSGAAQGRRQRRGDAAASDLERRRLCPARHALADEPADPRAAPSRSHLVRCASGHRRYSRLRSRAAYFGGKGQALSAKPVRHDRRADAGADHARSCQRRDGFRWSASSI